MLTDRVLDNRFALLERIGGGGMADVYRAHDRLLDRTVAVKVLRQQFVDDEQFVSRFRREAQAAARLSHPNIVNIYDVGEDLAVEPIYYIVMEYIPGETLKDKICREAPFPVEVALNIAKEIADALDHAHQNNLVHCDIKPHNILVTKTGRIKVTDFGIARAATSATMTHTGTILGSVHYFSPEQAQGTGVSAQSDIYSLGVVMYEMLTGQVPFTGDTPISIAIQHLQADPRPPRQINPDIPPLIDAMILKAMAKSPASRYKTVAELLEDLNHARIYLHDDATRRIAKEDFPTQVLTPIAMEEEKEIFPAVKSDRTAAAAAKPAKKRRSYAWIWALLSLLALGFAIGAFLAYGKFWSVNEVIVPNVVGKQVDTARNILLSQNLRVSISDAYSDKVPAGFVISQQPEPGLSVKEQRTVTIVVSRGAEITVVPDVRGLNRRDAELQIRNAGLKLGRIDEQFAKDTPADIVINQNPRPPAQLTKGAAVDIVVSKGAGPKKVVLPDFRGTPISTVTTQLDSLKLRLGSVSDAPSDKFPPGLIIGQNPVPAAEVDEGTAVDFVVSSGMPVAPRRETVSFVVPQGPPRQQIQIYVTDNTGRKLVFESVYKPGERVEKAVEGIGPMRVQVYVNKVLLQEQTF